MPVAFHWWYEMYGAVPVRGCVMVPTRLSISHWPTRSSTSRFSAVVRGASFGNGVLFDFCIFQRCVRFKFRQRAGLVTLGRHVGHFPHNPLELGCLFRLLLVMQRDFLAKFAWIRHFCCCSGPPLSLVITLSAKGHSQSVKLVPEQFRNSLFILYLAQAISLILISLPVFCFLLTG